ncbi:hypothetical protein H0H81_010534 [Sphagnurus paluster]|uniref:WD40 repeat-like protein n=1 Tax=Sphagnurus paluster TaxID=117069 RepID=A0A9P7FV32_9AGAR|nr:hypothetical protein H0H81_010534 [Sphagnurus paluster]
MTSNSSEKLSLPITTIERNFLSVIDDVNAGLLPFEKFWVSCYKTAQPSVHAKIQAELDERNRDLVLLKSIEGDVAIEKGSDGVYTISCETLGIRSIPVPLPVQEYLDPERSNPQRPQRITAFDVSPDSTRFATGFLDGSVFLYPISPSSTSPSPTQRITPSIPSRATARLHLSTITSLQFFPSSRVLLCAGADFSFSILPADLPDASSSTTHPSTSTSTSTSVRLTPARVLRGHTRPITATAILGRGKTLLSASLDGSVRLWAAASAAELARVHAAHPILSMVLDSPGAGKEETDEAYTHTVVCGLQDGSVQVFTLRTPANTFEPVYRTPPASAAGGVSALAYSPESRRLVAGSSRGVVSVWEVGDAPAAKLIVSFARGEAGVEGLAFLPSGEGGELRIAVATADGLPYVASMVGAEVRVHCELVGGEVDPVRVVRVRTAVAHEGKAVSDVWTAGDDAVVRRWRI